MHATVRGFFFGQRDSVYFVVMLTPPRKQPYVWWEFVGPSLPVVWVGGGSGGYVSGPGERCLKKVVAVHGGGNGKGLMGRWW